MSVKPRLIRIPEETAKRAVSALTHRHGRVMDDPAAHGKDGLAEVLQAGANNDREAALVIAAALDAPDAEVADLAARVYQMAKKRAWVMHWSTRGVYLHLEASELIEALRGKGTSSVKSEAADVLLVLMTITEAEGIPFDEVIAETERICAELEVKPPYVGEDSAKIREESNG